MMDDTTKDRYWPRTFEELAADPIPRTLLSEPVRENVIPLPKSRSLHAVLVESLNSSRALLGRLEGSGVTVSPEGREVIRETYVACRHLVKALQATLELPDLE